MKLADYISSHYRAKIVIIGGGNETGRATEMAEFLNPETQFVNTDGLFSLDELKALIQRLSLFISVDTAPSILLKLLTFPLLI